MKKFPVILSIKKKSDELNKDFTLDFIEAVGTLERIVASSFREKKVIKIKDGKVDEKAIQEVLEKSKDYTQIFLAFKEKLFFEMVDYNGNFYFDGDIKVDSISTLVKIITNNKLLNYKDLNSGYLLISEARGKVETNIFLDNLIEEKFIDLNINPRNLFLRITNFKVVPGKHRISAPNSIILQAPYYQVGLLPSGCILTRLAEDYEPGIVNQNIVDTFMAVYEYYKYFVDKYEPVYGEKNLKTPTFELPPKVIEEMKKVAQQKREKYNLPMTKIFEV
jgi:hypothetical protein